ncbi:MAG TPA: EAL domain-containing protein [Thermoanaerobaculia bacterium]|nr:EAL domain-containing protein [Thermoanaerobaculia bacterium]
MSELSPEQLRLLGRAVELAEEGVAVLTATEEPTGPRIALVNEGFCRIYGVDRDSVIGKPLTILGIVERHQAIFDDMMQHVFEDQIFDCEATARRSDGSEFEVDMHLTPLESDGEVTHWVAFLRDITETKNHMLLLRRQATYDSLTDLPNRTLLFERLEKAIDTARSRNTSVALLMMDLDRFAEINDTFGHYLGDVLLKQIADRLRALLAPNETLSRLGGDEFGLFLTRAIDANDVAAVARRILDSLQQPFAIDRHLLEVNASIGIAMYPQHGSDARTLLRRADAAMYSAKEANVGYAFHNQEHESRTPEQLALTVEMRRAMERDEFELYYQPKVHLSTGLMTRAEVLIRWNHPNRGLLPPGAFIPVAERTGLIKPMTEWIIDRMLQQCSEWHNAGAPVHVAVNISAKSLQDQMLPMKLQAALEKWNMDPRFVKAEITESSIMLDPARALAITSMLQSMGIRVSLDDFGTGYSSLSNLRQLPVDELKIDKSFVMGMPGSDADVSIVRTMVELAHSLGKQVCAEGVEDEDTFLRLAEMGCDLAQGYWISKPKPAGEFLQWLVDTFWGLKQVKASSRSAGPSQVQQPR